MNLCDIRKNNFLTQKEAAVKLNITAKYLSKIENGVRNPSDALRGKMADVYDVNVAEIFLAQNRTECS